VRSASCAASNSAPASRTVNVPNLAVRAAVDGLGIANTVEPLPAPLLRTGQLVRVLDGYSPFLETLFCFIPDTGRFPRRSAHSST
jgi:DNA-binding transcriptional LysR family regulator